MECEICGKEAGRGKRIEVDGSSLIVCEECSKFGKQKEEEVERARPVSAFEHDSYFGKTETAQQKAFGARPAKKINEPYSKQKEFDLGLEIAEDFGKRVRKAREQKGLTVKELAMKLFEKESLLHRIEHQSIKPSDKMIAKLEKELGIELKTKTS